MTKLSQLLLLVLTTCFNCACSDTPKEQREQPFANSSTKEEATIKTDKHKQQLRQLTDCPAHAMMDFYAQNGTLTQTQTSVIGNYSDSEVEMKTVFHSCMPRTISIRSKKSKANSFYRYANGVLITYDSIDPKGGQRYTYVENLHKNPKLPVHVIVDFNQLRVDALSENQ